MLSINRLKRMIFLLLACTLWLSGCSADDVEPEQPTAVAVEAEVETVVEDTAPEETADLIPEPVPTLRPIAPAASISDPADLLDEYMAEGLFISHFDEADLESWQGYSQDTEVTLSASETPPEGYLSSSNWHAKQIDKWVQPTDGFLLETVELINGDGAARWSDTVESTRIVTTDMPNDWSEYNFLTFWAYSAEANDAGIQLAIYSELDSTSTDDYYKKEIIIDWEGWRLFEIPLHEFRATREPVGWHKIDYIKIASSGWGHTPVASTELIFDEMKLSNVRIGPKLAIDFEAGREHPYLMLNDAEITAIQEKIENHEWARTAYATLQVRADRWLEQAITVPDTGGGFYHDDDAAAYAITERHYELVDGARDLALTYQLSDDPAYMEKSKEILLAYAESYLTYEITDKDGRVGAQASAGGRATAQGINEARWVIPLAWAYDLIYNDLTEAERTAVEDQILRPVAELLMLNNEGRHNHQTWYNSGVGVIGFALDDKEYVWYALLKDDSSLGYQLDKSVTADGMWYEGSMHYQFYVLRAMLPLMEVTHHAGFDVYSNPQYKALFDFMVTYADPTLKMPTINDGRVVNLTDSDRVTYYEIAYARLGDPRYVPILASSNRTDLNALLYGMPELGEPAVPVWQTQNYDESDLAVLRSGDGANSIQATLNYMGYQGGHSHADQLSLVLYGLGMPLAPDAGSIKYRLPEQEGWFKQTLSHNTLVVDGQSQERAAAAELTHFVTSEQMQMATMSHADLYPDVVLTRTVLLNDDYLIDLYTADSDTARTYDWVYHSTGTFSTEDVVFQAVSAPIGDSNGYEYLTNVEMATTADNWQGQWEIFPNSYVDIYLMGQPNTSYYTAYGPIAADVGDEMAEKPTPLLISRREADRTQFVSIIQPYQDGVAPIEVSSVLMTDDNGQTILPDIARATLIERTTATDLFILSDETSVKRVGDIELNGQWSWVSQSDGELQWVLTNGLSINGDGWAISQENLGVDLTPDGMGVYIEVAGPNELFVQNTYQFVTYIVIEGLLDSAVEIIELDSDGNPLRNVQPKKNEDGLIKFVAQPGAVHLVIGE